MLLELVPSINIMEAYFEAYTLTETFYSDQLLVVVSVLEIVSLLTIKRLFC